MDAPTRKLLLTTSTAVAIFAGPVLSQEVLPKPEPPFKGTIGRTYKDSAPDKIPMVKAPQDAPNILVILIDDCDSAGRFRVRRVVLRPGLEKSTLGATRDTLSNRALFSALSFFERQPETVMEKQSDDLKSWFTSARSGFNTVAQWTSRQCGRASTFILACVSILVWAASGPAFHYSDTWQLVINTGTTIVTFLMVFLIQNTQNRDVTALHLKLDELIRVNEGARNRMVDIETLTEEELERLKYHFVKLADKTSKAVLLREAASEEIEEAKDIGAVAD